ncbi:hypothetical protein [Flavobacterium sp. DG2-3]|uniref:ATP-binding protein n=1 Tax=Flavobacterium sp. DG2-3 TaxID=3068317 RepID=UPI00273EE673|nr:hypothetical protein [Flavobacterium sp. DG2-3]MDP5202417.1 hypothetical protein [Flavobacterium sp. DG2-3]
MKISASVKILVSIFFLVAVSISCKKEEPATAKKKNNTAEVKRLTIIGDNYFENYNFKDAYPIYKKIISLSDPEKDRIDYVDALISIAYIQQFDGNYLESESTATKVLPHLKYLKKPRFAWETYKIFSTNYLATNDYDNALIYAKKAYNLNTTVRRKANALANIALVYMHQNNCKKAIKIYIQLTTTGYYGNKKKANTLKDFELLDYAVMRSNIGVCYFSLGDSKALSYHKEALKIRLKLNDMPNLPDSYSNLSNYYLKSDPLLAKKYAQKAYKYACIVDTYKQKKYALETLIKTSTGNDLKKYSNLYIHLINDINEVRLSQKNQFANSKYNFRKDKEENLELKAQKTENELEMQRQKNRSFISYLIIFVSAMALVFIVFYVIKKGKKESNAEVFKNEMRISEKLQFELEKDIDKILLFSENHNLEKEGNKEEFLAYLNKIYSKTRNISRKNSEIATGENFEKGLKEMISGYTSLELNIIINGLNTFSWSKIDRIKKITIYRVVQEIMDLMKTLNNASLASITFKKEDKNILITYIDNGSERQDYSTDSNKRFSNIENRLKSVKGFFHISLNANRSFKIFIKLPI